MVNAVALLAAARFKWKLYRKSQRVRQDDAADSIGVSENFLGKVEKGSDSVNWGKLFQVLSGMGVLAESGAVLRFDYSGEWEDARVDKVDAFGLLQYYGAESAESIAMLPADQKPEHVSALNSLSESELKVRTGQYICR